MSGRVASARLPLGPGGIVFASTIGNALGVTPTVIVVFSVFLVPIAAEFQWSRAAVSIALALVSITTALASPIAGRVSDLIGARRTVLIGSAALALSIMSLAFAQAQPLLFYLQFAIIGVAGAVAGNMVYAKLLSEWFEARRGLWIGIAGGSGNGLGATILPFVAAALLPLAGWRGAFAGIGAIVLFIGFPIQYLLIRNAPIVAGRLRARSETSPDLEGVRAAAAFRSTTFWILTTSLAIGSGVLIAFFTAIVPLLTDRGFSVGAATSVIGMCSVTCMFWEPTVGFLLDHTTRPRNLAPLYLVAGAGLVLMLVAKSPAILLIAGVMMGVGLGAETSALYLLLSRYFGRLNLGTITGAATGVMLGSGALATILLNAAYDANGDYRIGVFCILPVLAWNAIAMLLLGRYPYTAETDVVSPAA